MAASAFSAVQSPFQRLRDLLKGIEPGASPIDMTIGEPRHGFPQFVMPIINAHAAEFGKYPPIAGTPELRAAIVRWIERRYGFALDPAHNVLPLCGTREGLVSALTVATADMPEHKRTVLMPNPFYQAYFAAAVSAHCEAMMLPASPDNAFLPDLEALSPELLRRTAAFYVASPANPQGAMASEAYLAKLVEMARAYGFYLLSDECYSEIYSSVPPQSALTIAAKKGKFDKVLSFNSLSKRSNAPGLRSGFIAGDPDFLARFLQYRNVASPQIPLPIQHASTALWSDEAHVEQSRALYRQKFDLAGSILSRLPNFRLPDGGLFLWLDVSHAGGGEAAAEMIWKGCGVKILPGAYLAQADDSGNNPGADYIRVALVDGVDVTREALERLAAALG